VVRDQTLEGAGGLLGVCLTSNEMRAERRLALTQGEDRKGEGRGASHANAHRLKISPPQERIHDGLTAEVCENGAVIEYRCVRLKRAGVPKHLAAGQRGRGG
jgi:hypothetical protein